MLASHHSLKNTIATIAFKGICSTYTPAMHLFKFKERNVTYCFLTLTI